MNDQRSWNALPGSPSEATDMAVAPFVDHQHKEDDDDESPELEHKMELPSNHFRSRSASSSSLSVQIYRQKQGLSPGLHRRRKTMFSNMTPYQLILAPKRRYEQWEGNNTFLCQGSYMLGAHPYQLLMSISLITITWLLFFSLLLPFLHHDLLYHFSICMYILNIVTLLLTACTEPGVYIRRRHSPDDDDLLSPSQCKSFSKSHCYCTICGIFTHPRARHCKFCNNCVDVYDHHCPWTGNCIGHRNYHWFFLFVCSIFVSSLFVALISFYLILSSVIGIETNYPVLRAIASFVCFTWIAFVLMLISALLAFHVYLNVNHMTTYEYFKRKRSRASKTEEKKTVLVRLKELGSHIALVVMKPSFSFPAIFTALTKSNSKDQGIVQSNAHIVEEEGAKLSWGCRTGTRLLPMWQYENSEDMKIQDQLLVQVLSTVSNELQSTSAQLEALFSNSNSV